MRNLLVLILIFTGLVIRAQSNIPYQNEKGKWGIKNNKGKIVIKAKYDRVDTADYKSLEFFNHHILAAIVDSTGKYLFQPKSKLISKSNAFVRYYYKDFLDLTSIQEEIDNSLFLYFSHAKTDTVIFKDSIIEFNTDTGNDTIMEIITNTVITLKNGNITLVDSKGKILNKKPFDNIALKTYYGNVEMEMEDIPFYEAYYRLKDNDNSRFDTDYPMLPLVAAGNIPFEQNNKWGLLNLEAGVIIKPVYDGFKQGDYKTIEFYNHHVLAAIVDNNGNYLFKPDKKLISRSNSYINYSLAHDIEDDTTKEIELKNELFVYFLEGQLDTLVYWDSLQEYDYDTDELLNSKRDIFVPFLKKGELVLVDGTGKSINEKAFNNLAFKAVAYRLEEDVDPYTGEYVYNSYTPSEDYSFIDIKNTENKDQEIKAFYREGLPEIQSHLFLFERNNKWGLLHLDKGVLIEPKYDSYEYDGVFRFFNHHVLAAIVDSTGKYLFQPDNNLVEYSDNYMVFTKEHEVWKDTNETAKLQNLLFLYLSHSIVDTLVIKDSLWDIENDTKVPAYKRIAIIKQGQIKLVNGRGKPLFTDAIDGMGFLSHIAEVNPEYEEYYYEGFYEKYQQTDKLEYLELGAKANSTQNYIGFYAMGESQISSDLILIQKESKWGLLDLKKGKIIEPQYDSYEYDGTFIHFVGEGKSDVMVDLDGNILEIIR